MALTDNRTQLQDCDATADVATDSTADPQSRTTETGLLIEGGSAIAFQVTNAQEYIAFDLDSAGATFNLDLSDSTIYINIKDNLNDTFGNLGALVVLNDGADGGGGDCIGYTAGGSDAVGLPYRRQYHAFKLDVSEPVATPGTDNVDFYTYNGTEAGLDQTAIQQIGYGSIHLAKAVGTTPNAWFDGIYYIANDSYAATINGGTSGTPETMTDVVGDDETVGACMFSNPKGSEFDFFAPTEWGNSTATANTYFTADNEQWYWIGDNGGGRSVGVGHFPFRIVGNATDTIDIKWTSIVIVNIGARATFTAGDTNVDVMQFDNVTFIDVGAITFPVYDANDKWVRNCTFVNCDQVVPSTSEFTDCTFNGTTDANGALLLSSGTNLDGLNFISDGAGHAIYITSTGTYDLTNFTYSGFGADGTTDAVVYNNSGGAVTLNISGGDTPTVRNGASATTTINNSVTVRVEGVTEGAAVKVIADETVGTITAGDVIVEGFADSNGVVQTTTFNYESAFDPSGLDVIARARSSGIPVAAIADDNGTFTDETTEANSSTTNDMTLLPAVPVANQDSYLFGHTEQFGQLKINVSTAGTGGFTITWEYWNGSSWASLSGVSDGTNSFANSGLNTVSYTIPGDWATTTVNSQGPFYYIRARYTAGTVTVVPKGRWAKLDVTRYLPFNQNRVITSTGLTVIATWTQDNIASF